MYIEHLAESGLFCHMKLKYKPESNRAYASQT